MTLSNSSRECAFGLLNRPLSREDLLRALTKARSLFRRGKIDAARRSVASVLALEAVFSQRLIPVPKKHNKKYSKSVLHGSWYEVSPVWKTAPSTAWKKANRLSMLLGTVAKVGILANIAHDLMRLATHVWSLTMRDFSGLCRKIELRCSSASNLVGEANYMPETALRRALSASPRSQDLEKVARSHLRRISSSKYGVKHRPSSLGSAAQLLSVHRRIKRD